MDPIIERFNRLIKSMFVDMDDIDLGYDDFSGSSQNDYADAWEELNDFLSSPAGSTGTRTSAKYSTESFREPPTPAVLRPDYELLGIPFGADFTEAKKAYKRLIVRYHPDKNSSSAETLTMATEKTKSLNISFQRIKAWEVAKKG